MRLTIILIIIFKKHSFDCIYQEMLKAKYVMNMLLASLIDSELTDDNFLLDWAFFFET